MTSPSRTISDYDAAIRGLVSNPDKPALQHKAVLALARAGSLAFAQAEYQRYGLDQIATHESPTLLEDIMALGGRLAKDHYLASSGEAAKVHAWRSANLYEAAFQKTGGYYSGINAATMGLLAGEAAETYRAKARKLLSEIPETGHSRETKYYVEATRAEAHLLLEENTRALAAMRRAWDHDPLNYTAQATTLKQFKLIHGALGGGDKWPPLFEPPKAVHFAGHLFRCSPPEPYLSDLVVAALHDQVSDIIQSRDIGFGYGALAAGSDILIAEVLMEEGAELHVILPVPKEVFKAKSVAPFGPEWEARFEACLRGASSVEITSDSSDWPNEGLDRFAGRIAMGHTVMRAQNLCVTAEQLLIWDGKPGPTGTAADALIWRESGRVQNIVPYGGVRTAKATKQPVVAKREIILAIQGQDKSEAFDSIEAAATAAAMSDKGSGLAIGLKAHGMDTEGLARQLAERTVPGGVLMSEAFAGHLALHKGSSFSGDFMGRMDMNPESPRMYALKPAVAFE